jgi:sortase A
MTTERRIHWLQRGLLVLGLLLLAVWARSYFESRGFQSAESKKLTDALRQAEHAPSRGTATRAPDMGSHASSHLEDSLGRTGALGRLEIPRLGISAMVAEGADAPTLRRAVGHIRSTAEPGALGNCALAGHRDTFLSKLEGVRVNDVVRMVTIDRTYVYSVRWIEVVEPQQVEVLDSTATRSLTLVTCYPFTLAGHAPRRFIVRAEETNVATREPMALSPSQAAPSP